MNRLRRILNRPEKSNSAVGPLLSGALLVGIVCVGAFAQQGRPSATPEEVVSQVPSAEAAGEMGREFRRWVDEDVVYIIEDEEREAFWRLETGEEREHFIEQFWQRRDPTPGTVANEFREEHYRRIAYANGRWSVGDTLGWRTERGHVYIVNGPPDEITSWKTGQVWVYHPRGAPTGLGSADADRVFEFDLSESE